jgi:hypothetical protein
VWRAKVYLGREDGKSKRYLQRTIHGTKRQAEDVLNELLVEAAQSSNAIVDGTFGDPGSPVSGQRANRERRLEEATTVPEPVLHG